MVTRFPEKSLKQKLGLFLGKNTPVTICNWLAALFFSFVLKKAPLNFHQQNKNQPSRWNTSLRFYLRRFRSSPLVHHSPGLPGSPAKSYHKEFAKFANTFSSGTLSDSGPKSLAGGEPGVQLERRLLSEAEGWGEMETSGTLDRALGKCLSTN